MQSSTPDLVFLSPVHCQRHLDKMAAVQSKFRPLSDTNDAVPAVTAPAVSGQAGGTQRKSNFDLTGKKLVKRGAVVSWNGIRFTVSRVRLGTCYPTERINAFITPSDFFDCNSVQVVV